jgi:hypothetical protein
MFYYNSKFISEYSIVHNLSIKIIFKYLKNACEKECYKSCFIMVRLIKQYNLKSNINDYLHFYIKGFESCVNGQL